MEHLDILEAALCEEAGRTPGGTLERTDAWVQLTTPDAKTPYRNGVFRSVFADDEADERIESVIRHYAALDLPFRWIVTPSSRPRDLAARLLRGGLRPFETLKAMVAAPRDFPAPAAGGAVRVEEVGPERAEEWLACMGRGWSMPDAGVARFREEMRLGLAARPRRRFYFLASLDGEPAGTASLSLRGDTAHLSGAAVEPRARRRGVYRELLAARMAFLRDRGVGLATNHCVATTSAPICARLGFATVCDFEGFVGPPA